MRILAIILSLIFSATCFAGIRRAPIPHAITSPGGKYVFTMLPGPKGQEYEKGFGICYKIENDGRLTEIWRTSGFYSVDLELNYEGNVLARIGSWSSADQEKGDAKDSLAVAFYVKGKEIANYRVSNLVKDESKLQNTTAGVMWLEYKSYESPSFVHGEDIYQLETVDGILYQFDIKTGKIIKNKANKP